RYMQQHNVVELSALGMGIIFLLNIITFTWDVPPSDSSRTSLASLAVLQVMIDLNSSSDIPQSM
ncbi:hypothetical protein FRX31_006899, partial [Thalictrum thalictroides]